MTAPDAPTPPRAAMDAGEHLRAAVGSFLLGLLIEPELRLTLARHEVLTRFGTSPLAARLWSLLADYDDGVFDADGLRRHVRAALGDGGE